MTKLKWLVTSKLGLCGLPLLLTACGGPPLDLAPQATSAVSDGPAPAPAPAPAPVGSATITWSIPTSNVSGAALIDIDGYRIHYGTSAANLNQSAYASGAGSTSYVVNGLAPGTYYFAVATVNSIGIASSPSSAISKVIQ